MPLERDACMSMTRSIMVKLDAGKVGGSDQFRLDPNHFPEATKRMFTPQEMRNLGIVPLGVKRETKMFKTRKILNVGIAYSNRFVKHEVLMRIIRRRLRKFGLDGARFYLVRYDNFIDALYQVFDMQEDTEIQVPKVPSANIIESVVEGTRTIVTHLFANNTMPPLPGEGEAISGQQAVPPKKSA